MKRAVTETVGINIAVENGHHLIAENILRSVITFMYNQKISLTIRCGMESKYAVSNKKG